MAKDDLQNVQQADYPLTVTVTMDEDDREVHRTQLAEGADLTALTSGGLVSDDLEERYPGKKKLRVVDSAGKTRFEKSAGDS